MTVVPTGISVVVPTRGRSRLTERPLMSLAEARVGFEPSCEVLIVDDSPDPERQEVQQLCLSHNARYVPGMASVPRREILAYGKRSTRLCCLWTRTAKQRPRCSKSIYGCTFTMILHGRGCRADRVCRRR